jgi:hypothetical protein
MQFVRQTISLNVILRQDDTDNNLPLRNLALQTKKKPITKYVLSITLTFDGKNIVSAIYIYIYIYIYMCVCVCVCVCVCTCTGLMITQNVRNNMQLTYYSSCFYKTTSITHTCYFISPTHERAHTNTHTHTHTQHFTLILRLRFVLRLHHTFKTLGDLVNCVRCIDKYMRVEGRFSSV